METSEEGFLVSDCFGHFSAADINYSFLSTACLPDLFARDSVNLEECVCGLAHENEAGHSHVLQKSLLKKKLKKELEQPVCQTCRTK